MYSNSLSNSPQPLPLGEIAVVHTNPGTSVLYVETTNGSQDPSTLAIFVTKNYVDSAVTRTLDIISALTEMTITGITVNGENYSGNSVNLGNYLSGSTEYVKSIAQVTTVSAITTTFTMQDGTTTYSVEEPIIIDCGTY